ncbi:hypothetical protein [Paenibacillus sp. Cedars]|uniref:hypothetical protein n=1 Tax=Paenibacillus sp. Cedars TaxID=1980674 RepID=UPI0011651443|nr:hypothetical protein [Paenibacillus sp. Cedars]AWP27951.1 hypothetical protein B9D94_15565 [Paenibacillus sp. Cedars]
MPADTTGILRTQLLGQVGFYILSEDIFAPIIQIDVMRGYLTTDPVIHTTYVQYQPSQVQSQSVSFVAADYNVTPPPTGLLVYTMYVTALVLDMAEQDQNALMLPYIRIRAASYRSCIEKGSRSSAALILHINVTKASFL